MLKAKIPGYDKAIDFKMFNTVLNSAGARAKRIGDHAREDGENLYVNPTTSVFLLVASMLKVLKGKEPYEGWVWLQQALVELEE